MLNSYIGPGALAKAILIIVTDLSKKYAGRIHLASASPRRVALLKGLGLTFTAAGVDIDETPRAGESAETMVQRLAAEKAQTGARAASPDCVTIGSDTTVCMEGQILGKPTNADHARAMLTALSGRSHQVLTAVSVVKNAAIWHALSITSVQFRDIGRDEVASYWQTGEPHDKAGAYAIQGLGGMFVNSISGSYSGVMGLPIYETSELLAKAGINVLSEFAADGSNCT